ncbi:helix-turn-helix domain-containing protein [Bradyrhizobium sp. URHD0069]|uniref:helix-turn-helix domain-containing protein n=1 Tax=Bradyrhizobium sp. URHD0069 TaxID=1380355 RepID=UPI000A5426C2|nr:helix-turn-helix domain-containing protein [Bradyrhizobium sp. URHD0069]
MTKPTSTATLQPANPAPQTPWRERPLQPMKVAAELCGVSIASLYRFSDEGRLVLRRLGGRTLVETKSLIALIESAEDWTPYDRGKEARAKRKEIARAAMQG